MARVLILIFVSLLLAAVARANLNNRQLPDVIGGVTSIVVDVTSVAGSVFSQATQGAGSVFSVATSAGGSAVTVATNSAAEVASAATSAASGVRKTVTMTASAAARPTNGAGGLHSSGLLATFMLAVSLITGIMKGW
ncbi:hypothetical protein PM082_002726 [Marasmius tenuissimus]|nr:hypothetical protein PM082_002726 [Marasmius tenuissimus]